MEFNFRFSLSVLNHLGRGLYRSFATVIAEAISNSWDADAESVHVEIKKDSLVIWDNGVGMDIDDLQDKFLKIGYRRRDETQTSKVKKRPVLGRKGIGKLAYLSVADKVIVITKKKGSKDVISVVMDNREIDKDVDKDVDVQESKLPGLSDAELKEYCKIQESGTQLVFKGLKKHLRRHNIRAILATQFHFSYVLEGDDKFEIFVKDDKADGKIGIKDLKNVYQDGQYAWFFNETSRDKFFIEMKKAGIKTNFDKTSMIHLSDKNKSDKLANINGYILSVEELPNLYVSAGQKDFKASVALFATGRMRESDFVSKISKSQLPENYLFGQIHVDSMDDDDDRFTSARDSVKEDDELYIEFQELMKKALLQIMDEWRKWRKDDEPTTPQERLRKKSDDMFMQWLKDSGLVSRAEYPTHPLTKYIRYMANENIPSYLECFVAENLMRYYISNKAIDYSKCLSLQNRDREKPVLDEEGNPIVIREPLFGTKKDDTSYLSAQDMASIIDRYNRILGKQEKKKIKYSQETSLEKYPKVIRYDDNHHRPLRNAVMHTSLLTNKAKFVADTGWGIITKKILKWLKGENNN